MTHYETLFIVHPERVGKVKEFGEKFSKVIEGLDGSVSQIDEWGLRDLAYPIRKQGRGHYTLLRYRSSARAVEELERNMKLTDGVLRYLTVRMDEESESKVEPKTKDLPGEAKESGEEGPAKSESQS